MTQKSTYTQDPWSLKDLFDGYDDPKYEALFDEIKKGVEEFQNSSNLISVMIYSNTLSQPTSSFIER